MDNRLRVHADSEQIATEFLESPSRGFDILESACEHAMGGLHFLQHTLNQINSGSSLAELQRILDAWLSNDLPALTTIHGERLAEFPIVFEPLITQRSREWIPVASQLIPDPTPTLFIVGALHTVGADSFIARLEDEGYRLTQTSESDA